MLTTLQTLISLSQQLHKPHWMAKVDNSQVLTNVPLGAKFTDTIYSHPSNHPASMITESTSRMFVSDIEKNKVECSG